MKLIAEDYREKRMPRTGSEASRAREHEKLEAKITPEAE